jgi:hypothetical protein
MDVWLLTVWGGVGALCCSRPLIQSVFGCSLCVQISSMLKSRRYGEPKADHRHFFLGSATFSYSPNGMDHGCV